MKLFLLTCLLMKGVVRKHKETDSDLNVAVGLFKNYLQLDVRLKMDRMKVSKLSAEPFSLPLF